MRTETSPSASRNPAAKLPAAFAALVAVTALIAALAYVISAWGVTGFAREIWRLPGPLAVASGLGADLLSLAGAFAAYVLRDAAFRVRLYAWCVFGGMTALSMLANEQYAVFRGLVVGGRAASAVIVLALAAAVHLLIVARRHADTTPAVRLDPTPARTPAVRRDPPRAIPPQYRPLPIAPMRPPPPVVAAKPTPRGPRPAVAPPPPSRRPVIRRTPAPAGADARDEAIRMVLSGELAKDEAAELIGRSVRRVEQLVKEASAPAVNGHRPEVDVTP